MTVRPSGSARIGRRAVGKTEDGDPPGRCGESRNDEAYSPSRGAPWMSRGRRNGFPVNRRIVAWSIRRSAMATACAGEGMNSPHSLNGRFNAEYSVMRS